MNPFAAKRFFVRARPARAQQTQTAVCPCAATGCRCGVPLAAVCLDSPSCRPADSCCEDLITGWPHLHTLDLQVRSRRCAVAGVDAGAVVGCGVRGVIRITPCNMRHKLARLITSVRAIDMLIKYLKRVGKAQGRYREGTGSVQGRHREGSREGNGKAQGRQRGRS
eukprot:162262-Chlamydomonas_euryale.AAC.2